MREKREVRAQWEKWQEREEWGHRAGEWHRQKQARKDTEEGFQELLAWVRVALVEGVGKVQGPKVQAVVARSLSS